MNDNKLSIWVGSYGAYNAGRLVGKWIALPMSHTELWDTIHEACMTTSHYGDEVGVFDYDDASGLKVAKLGEGADIDELNALAAALEETNYDPDAINAWRWNHPYELSALQLANVVMDCDNIPFFRYYYDGKSKEERYGKFLVIDGRPDLYNTLVEHGVEDYFDYESYGSGPNDDVLFEDGYLAFNGGDPDTDYYKTAQELLEELGYWDDEED